MQRIKELDGLRGISVLFVIAFHMTEYSGHFHLPPTVQLIFTYLGGLGVRTFFVISGFIITHLLIAEHERTGRISLKSFYARRFFRIIPTYWSYVASILFLAAIGAIILKDTLFHQTAAFIVSLLFLSDIIYPGWFLGHTWSLSVEEQYYIFFPLCFALIYRSSFRKTIMAGFLIFIFTSAFFQASITQTLLSILYFVYGNFDWNQHCDFEHVFCYTYIAVGVAMAIYWPSVSTFLRRVPIIFTIFLSLLIFSYPLIPIPNFIDASHPLLLGTVIGSIIVKPDYFGLLRWRVIQILGATSYSIYLWQQLFTGSPSNYGTVHLSDPLVAVPALIFCVSLSYYLIERKFIDLGRRLNRRDDSKTSVI